MFSLYSFLWPLVVKKVGQISNSFYPVGYWIFLYSYTYSWAFSEVT